MKPKGTKKSWFEIEFGKYPINLFVKENSKRVERNDGGVA